MKAKRTKHIPEFKAKVALAALARGGDRDRSTAYYEPMPTTEEDLAVMRPIDELYRARPMAVRLRERGHEVNRKRVQRFMRLMSLVGLQPRRSTSPPHPEHGAPVQRVSLRFRNRDRLGVVHRDQVLFAGNGQAPRVQPTAGWQRVCRNRIREAGAERQLHSTAGPCLLGAPSAAYASRRRRSGANPSRRGGAQP
jgi:hypothetical protein